MNQKQSAVVNYAPEPKSVALREVPVPSIGANEVLFEVAFVGVCGSDLHMWTGDQSWPVAYPCVLGHEFSGTIRAVGPNVSTWKVGDRVVSETAALIDAEGPMNRKGLYNLDPNRRGFGAAVDGAMTRFVRVPTRILHRVPSKLSLEKAALCEPCCVAYNAVVNNGSIQPGDRIVVIGPGPIGLLCAAMARLQGAEVAVVGLPSDEQRLRIAEAYGCSSIQLDPKPWAYEVDGLGADGVIDATGVSAALKTALQIVRPNGWISKVGWGPQALNFSLDLLVQKNVRLQGSFSHNWPIWERVLRLLSSGALNVEPIMGGIWDLSEWETAFQTMYSGQIAKAILRPSS